MDPIQTLAAEIITRIVGSPGEGFIPRDMNYFNASEQDMLEALQLLVNSGLVRKLGEGNYPCTHTGVDAVNKGHVRDYLT